MGWGTFAVLLSALGVALVHGLGSYLVPRFQESMGAMLFLLGGLVLLWGLVNLFVTLFQAASLALVTVRLYERVGGGQAAEAPAVSVAAPVEAVVSRLSARAALGVLLIAAAVCGGIGYYLLQRVKIDREVVAIGHRGAAGRAPENTLAAVDAAIEDGADLVEIDVQETKDGRVVVIHDSDFMSSRALPPRSGTRATKRHGPSTSGAGSDRSTRTSASRRSKRSSSGARERRGSQSSSSTTVTMNDWKSEWSRSSSGAAWVRYRDHVAEAGWNSQDTRAAARLDRRTPSGQGGR